MTTAVFAITQAAQQLGTGSIINPIATESQNAAFTRLLQMLNRWITKDIDLGDSFLLPIELSSEMGNDDNTEQAIIDNLAVMIAPILRKTADMGLKSNAYDAYQDLLISAVQRPEQPYPGSLPRGAGRRSWPLAKRYYTEPTRKDPQTVVPDEQ